METHEVLSKLAKADELDIFQGSVPESDVQLLSEKTNCELPVDYKLFLTTVGFASWSGHSVFGIYDTNDSRFPDSYNYSALAQTIKARKLHNTDHYPFYDNSIVIGKDGMGGFFVLLCDGVSSQEGVRWISQDEQWVITQSWDSFTSFLSSQLQ
jgi:hypothetical protein